MSVPRIVSPWTEWLEDFYTPLVAADWTITVVGSGTASVSTSGSDGRLDLVTSALENDSVQVQRVIRAFRLQTHEQYFDAHIKRDHATDGELLVGIVEADSTAIDNNNGVYFSTVDTQADVYFTTMAGGVPTTVDTGVDLLINTWYAFGFHWDGATAITPYINGVAGTPHTTNLPITSLTPTLAVRAGAVGEARALRCDMIRIRKLRERGPAS